MLKWHDHYYVGESVRVKAQSVRSWMQENLCPEFIW